MMDGFVSAIRDGLDEAGFEMVPILSYSVKYAPPFTVHFEMLRTPHRNLEIARPIRWISNTYLVKYRQVKICHAVLCFFRTLLRLLDVAGPANDKAYLAACERIQIFR